MFGISGLELAVILIVAIAVIPADKWPDAARAAARAVRAVQHWIGKVQDGIDNLKTEIEKEAPIDALTADVIENFREPLKKHHSSFAARKAPNKTKRTTNNGRRRTTKK